MTLLYTQTVVILRAPLVVDRYGNSVRDWTRATRTTVRRVSVQPDASAEGTGDRPVIVTGWRLVTRRGVDVDLEPGDRIEHEGRLTDVDGDVGRYVLGGVHHHTEARLRGVTG
ncbi:hypothetical protein ACFWPV_28480 [Streptomyces uncialis]|uniref:hypothetical protein n=1 Tax=Streptomyces uncialis TaxID=1048205 RepID=UPI0036666592